MFKATISRYHGKTGTTKLTVDIPDRVTITGQEDQFARAYEDLHMVLRGMREMDDKLGLDDARTDEHPEAEPWTIRYYVDSLARV